MGASGRRATREVGRGDAGGDDREGWSRESGSSDAISDADSEEVEEDQPLLMALPQGMQKSGARGLQMGVRAGGRGGGKATSGTADGEETRRRHGERKQHGDEKGDRWGWESYDPLGVGATLGAARSPELAPIPTE